MSTPRQARKLAAILHADVVGFSQMMGEDETGTHRALRLRLDDATATISEFHGRVVNYAGDAILADFPTVTDALSAAVAIQDGSEGHVGDPAESEENPIQFRVGVNLGEVIIDGDDIYGDGVNVAARLESLAEPGGICVSEAVRTAARANLSFNFEFLGERSVKNIAAPIRVYRMAIAGEYIEGRPPRPYPGMVPFSAAEAPHFYGRSDEVARMVQLLRHQRFMMVIGPSGSGKSSLVYAGLLPELRNSRYFENDYWLIRTMRPGAHPTEVLAELIGHADETSDFDPDTVDRLLKANAPAQRLLLLIDQFEEVFTQASREEQARFIAALQAFRVPENCALILTLRADFYPDLMTSYLWPVDASQRIEVAPLRGDALREAIEHPAADVGVHIEESLASQLLLDAADEPGALPLLQETMGLLWDDIEHRTLNRSAYDRLSRDGRSGLAVAISMKADATLAELAQDKQKIARRIFLRLVQFGEGRADTRRQQLVSALKSVGDDEAALNQTLEHLTANRLLTRSGGTDAAASAVDISHESLIDGWSRLQVWADERREAEQTRRRLEGKAAEWIRLGKKDGGLLDEAELPEAERWLASEDAVDLGYDETLPELVVASERALENAARAREEARDKELKQAEALADEQRQRIAEQTHAAGRMRRLVAGLAIVLVAAVGAGLFAWTQSEKAQLLAVQEADARAEAEAQRLVSVAQLLLLRAPEQQAKFRDETGALLARQAYLFAPDAGPTLNAELSSVLREMVGKPYFSATLDSRGIFFSIAVSASGDRLATPLGGGRQFAVWNLRQQGQEPRIIDWPHGGIVNAIDFSPDGKKLVAAGAKGEIVYWDLEDPEASAVELIKQKGGAWSLAFSPDGRWLAVGGKFDDTISIWDMTAPEGAPQVLVDPEPAEAGSGPDEAVHGGVSVAFSPDGMKLATGSLDGKIRLWDVADLSAQPASLPGHEAGTLALLFSPDGALLATSGQDATIKIWHLSDVSSNPVILTSGVAPHTSLDFSSDGARLVAAGSEGMTIWQLDDLGTPSVFIAGGFIFQAKFALGDKRLVSAGGDFIRTWNLEPSGQPRVLMGHAGSGVLSLAFSPDSDVLASGGGTGDGKVLLWNRGEWDAAARVFHAHDGTINWLDFSRDGSHLLSTSWNENTLRLWNLGQSPPTSITLNLPAGQSPQTAWFGPQQKKIYSGGSGGLLAWDIENLAADPKSIITTETYLGPFEFAPDGDTFAWSRVRFSSFISKLTEPNSTPIELKLSDRKSDVYALAFNNDGRLLVTGDRSDKSVRLWSLNGTKPSSIILGRHDEAVTRVRFRSDGKQIASSSTDHSVRLWDVEKPGALPIVFSGPEGQVRSLAYSPDGELLAAGSRDKKVWVWDLTHRLNSSNTGEIAEWVCQIVWRNLSIEEWHEFVGVDIPYERTCPNLPIHPSLFETAEKLAKGNDVDGAVMLLSRALEIDPMLQFDPSAEALRLRDGEK